MTNEVESGWSDTSDLKPLDAAAPLCLTGLSETDVKPEHEFSVADVEARRMPVHVLIKIDRTAPNVELMSFSPTCWLVTGSAENALNTRGIRRKLYQLAAAELGYYDPANVRPDTGNTPRAFWYENSDDIQIHVLFKKEEHALYFQSRLADDFSSPIDVSVSQVTCPTDLERILRQHYVADEYESPQLTMISSEISVFDRSNPVFKYQRIEADGFFGSYGKAESAHLISASHCRSFTSYARFDDDDNNRLALSREMHGAYDGLNYDFPVVNIEFVSASEHAELDDRYKVELRVSVYSHEYVFLLARLKDESTRTEDPLAMKTFVYVQNKNVFRTCIQWKFSKNEQLRKDFFTFNPRAT